MSTIVSEKDYNTKFLIKNHIIYNQNYENLFKLISNLLIVFLFIYIEVGIYFTTSSFTLPINDENIGSN